MEVYREGAISGNVDIANVDIANVDITGDLLNPSIPIVNALTILANDFVYLSGLILANDLLHLLYQIPPHL